MAVGGEILNDLMTLYPMSATTKSSQQNYIRSWVYLYFLASSKESLLARLAIAFQRLEDSVYTPTWALPFLTIFRSRPLRRFTASLTRPLCWRCRVMGLICIHHDSDIDQQEKNHNVWGQGSAETLRPIHRSRNSMFRKSFINLAKWGGAPHRWKKTLAKSLIAWNREIPSASSGNFPLQRWRVFGCIVEKIFQSAQC